MLQYMKGMWGIDMDNLRSKVLKEMEALITPESNNNEEEDI